MHSKKQRLDHRFLCNFSRRHIPTTTFHPSVWYRLHETNLNPIYFAQEGRFSPINGNYKVLYLASDKKTCLLEKLGNEIHVSQNTKHAVRMPRSIFANCCLSKINVPKLCICDLTKQDVLDACSVDLDLLMAPNFEISHAWACAIMNHPNNFDAINYFSRFTKSACLALFDKSSLRPQIRSLSTEPLDKLEAEEQLLEHLSK